LGDLWKWARAAANFAAFLLYNSISRVSRWFFYLHPFKILHSTRSLCIGQVKVYFHIREQPRNTVFEFVKRIARTAIVISDADPH